MLPNMATAELARVDRMTIHGWPIDAVEQLDAQLREHFGGAQLWRLAGDQATAVVGIAYPKRPDRVEVCHQIVDEWQRDHALA
jgi:hypothetical protein